MAIFQNTEVNKMVQVLERDEDQTKGSGKRMHQTSNRNPGGWKAVGQCLQI